MTILAAFAGGGIAILLGLAGNRLIWKLFAGRGSAWAVPIWEELVKTGTGLLTGHILAVHVLFGLGEAAGEAGRGQWLPALAALASHSFFGALTILGGLTPPPSFLFPAGWLLAIGAHLAWNQFVLRHSGA